MLNYIWCFFILSAVGFGILNGNFLEVNNSIFSSIKNTIELCISLLRCNVLLEWHYEYCYKYKYTR